MNKSVKGIAIVAAAMVTVGLILTGIGFMAGGNQAIYLDQDGIHLAGRETGEKDANLVSFSQDIESFSSISVDLDYYDVELVPGDNFSVQGSYPSKEGKPDLKVENDTLVVKDRTHKGININIDLPGFVFNNNQPTIKIYYPENTKLKDVVIRCGASDLDFENLTAEKAEFDLDFGKLELSGITANQITVSMNSGDCTLEKLTAANGLDIKNDFGKISLIDAVSETLKIDANSGDVSLTNVTFDFGELSLDMGKLTGKNLKSEGLKAETNSGDVDLQGTLLGLTDVTCDMGKVTINPGASRDQFNYEFNADMGTVSIEGDKVSGSVAINNGSAKNTLKIATDMGDIRVMFN